MKSKAKEFEFELKCLGDRIRSLREELELKRSHFSKKVGISQHVITAYERGETKPGFEFFHQAMVNLDANPLFLLSGKGNMFIGNGEQEKDKDSPLAFIDGNESKTALKEFLDMLKMSKWLRLRTLAFFQGVKITDGETLRKDIELTTQRLKREKFA